MKKLHYILGISFLLPVFAFAPAFAIATGTGSGDKTTTASGVATTSTVGEPTPTDTSDPSEKGTKIGEPSTDPTAMKARLEALKTKLKVNLDLSTKNKIIQKCKPAQTIVDTTEKTDKSNGAKREEVYKKITDALKNLIARLKTDGVDTTTLAADEATLELKIATFNTDITTLQQTLSDLHGLDCATDPAAFHAALLTARTQRDTVHSDALAIRMFVTTTIKADLKAIRDKLKTAKDESSDTTTTTDQTKTTGGTQ